MSNRCKRCILSEKYCKLTNGICEHCISAIPLIKSTVLDLTDKLDLFIKSTKAWNLDHESNYDATLMLSGGKDSAYVLHKLRNEYPDLRILCLTINNGFMSESAICNASKVAELTKTDSIIINSKTKYFYKKLKQAFLDLKGRGSYGTVDFADGSSIFQTGQEITQSMDIPYMIGGLSWVQAEQIIGINDFIKYNDNFKIIFPLVVWRTNEQEIRSYVRSNNLLPVGQDSPVVSNNLLILTMCAIDILNIGYCSFEPEFAQLIREGKADRKTWLHAFELLEYGTKKGRLSKEINQTLKKLELNLSEIIED